MASSLISLLIAILVCGLLYWAVTTILGVLPIPEPFMTVVKVILIVIVCLWLIQILTGFLPATAFPHWK